MERIRPCDVGAWGVLYLRFLLDCRVSWTVVGIFVAVSFRVMVDREEDCGKRSVGGLENC